MSELFGRDYRGSCREESQGTAGTWEKEKKMKKKRKGTSVHEMIRKGQKMTE